MFGSRFDAVILEIDMKNVLIYLIKFYKKFLSPLKSTKCPYFPSCSDYGLEAVRTHGAIKGSLLTAWRILRCNPFSKGGYDPVPKIRKPDNTGNQNVQEEL